MHAVGGILRALSQWTCLCLSGLYKVDMFEPKISLLIIIIFIYISWVNSYLIMPLIDTLKLSPLIYIHAGADDLNYEEIDKTEIKSCSSYVIE